MRFVPAVPMIDFVFVFLIQSASTQIKDRRADNYVGVANMVPMPK
jgi:hypothetical protein